MATYNKVGLLVLSEDKTKFLLCEKDADFNDLILPGGKYEGNESDAACLKREIKEELNSDIDLDSLEIVGEYEDQAAGNPNETVYIKLYQGKLIQAPQATNEIKNIYWVSQEDEDRFSYIIRTRIFPDLLKKKILKT